MKKFVVFVLFMFLPLIGGKISAFISGDMSAEYVNMIQPAYSPPGYVFPIVWIILYLLMGFGSWLVYQKALKQNKNPENYLRSYGIQLALNYLWSPIFFGIGAFWVGSWLAIALAAAVLWMIISFSNISKLAAYLQIPYLIWALFACYLSFGVAVLNS